MSGEKDGDEDGDTPDLSSAESSSNDHSSSSATTPPPSTVVVPPTPTMPPSALSPSPHGHSVGKEMTKRQRKRLGLPKSQMQYENDTATVRDVHVGGRGVGTRTSAGKIKVPGGKFRKAATGPGVVTPGSTGAGEGNEGGDEWVRNGNGRVDVRGFKELKI